VWLEVREGGSFLFGVRRERLRAVLENAVDVIWLKDERDTSARDAEHDGVGSVSIPDLLHTHDSSMIEVKEFRQREDSRSANNYSLADVWKQYLGQDAEGVEEACRWDCRPRQSSRSSVRCRGGQWLFPELRHGYH